MYRCGDNYSYTSKLEDSLNNFLILTMDAGTIFVTHWPFFIDPRQPGLPRSKFSKYGLFYNYLDDLRMSKHYVHLHGVCTR